MSLERAVLAFVHRREGGSRRPRREGLFQSCTRPSVRMYLPWTGVPHLGGAVPPGPQCHHSVSTRPLSVPQMVPQTQHMCSAAVHMHLSPVQPAGGPLQHHLQVRFNFETLRLGQLGSVLAGEPHPRPSLIPHIPHARPAHCRIPAAIFISWIRKLNVSGWKRPDWLARLNRCSVAETHTG